MAGDLFGPNPRNLGAVLAAAIAIAIALDSGLDPGIRYAAGLALFTVWMLWFVLTGVEVLRQRR